MRLDLKKASYNLSNMSIRVTDGELEIDVLWLRAMIQHHEWFIKRHTHSTYEFHFIVQGSCKVILDEDEFIINKGEFYITAPWMHHEQQSINVDQFIEYSLNCSYKLVSPGASEAYYLLNVLNKAPCKPYKDTEKVFQYFNKAFEEACQQRLGFFSNIKQYVMKITVTAVRSMIQDTPFIYNDPYKNAGNNVRISKIIGFIEDNISSPISIDDIARYMYLSKKQVYRIIKEQLGISTKDLLVQIKIKKAKELLKDPHLAVKEVADAIGCSSEYYFYRFFKREAGCTPTAYRHSLKLNK